MARLWLVRHGESEGNAAGVVQGQLEYPLNEMGLHQARAVAGRLAGAGAARLVSSPLQRARDTAAEIAAATGLALEFEPRLMEYHYGERAGLTLDEARTRYASVFDAAAGARPVFPGEEGRDLFNRRVRDVMDELLAHAEDAIVVTHGGVLSAMCYLIAGVDHSRARVFRPRNGAITVVSAGNDGTPILEVFNDACHLESEPGEDVAYVF